MRTPGLSAAWLIAPGNGRTGAAATSGAVAHGHARCLQTTPGPGGKWELYFSIVGGNERLDAGSWDYRVVGGPVLGVKKGRTGELDRTAHHSTLSTLHSPTPRRLASFFPQSFWFTSSLLELLLLLPWRPLCCSCSCSPCSPAQTRRSACASRTRTRRRCRRPSTTPAARAQTARRSPPAGHASTRSPSSPTAPTPATATTRSSPAWAPPATSPASPRSPGLTPASDPASTRPQRAPSAPELALAPAPGWAPERPRELGWVLELAPAPERAPV